MFFQTTNLLLYIVYFGFVVAGLGVLFAIYLIYLNAVSHPLPGWTSVMVLLLIIGGFIITSTGVTGLYIGRVFQQVKGRPLYVVDTVTLKTQSRPAVREKRPAQEVESIR